MTKILDLSTLHVKEETKKKPIEFVLVLDGDKVVNAKYKPCSFDVVELLCENYIDGYDVFFAYQESAGRNSGSIYFGHKNDMTVD